MDKKNLNNIVKNSEAEKYYVEVLQHLNKLKIPFMIAGTYAFQKYTGIFRETKDLDLFCKAGDLPRLLKSLSDLKYKTEITDERWLAKVYSGSYYIDIIFGSKTNLQPVDDTWLKYASSTKLFGQKVKITAAEELIWSKAYRQDRYRFDGADVNHLILKNAKKLDWKRLLMRFEQHWEVLLAQILSFRFVYPSERKLIPLWFIKKLLSRIEDQLNLSSPSDKVCRGPLLSHVDYLIDINEWEFRSIT